MRSSRSWFLLGKYFQGGWPGRACQQPSQERRHWPECWLIWGSFFVLQLFLNSCHFAPFFFSILRCSGGESWAHPHLIISRLTVISDGCVPNNLLSLKFKHVLRFCLDLVPFRLSLPRTWWVLHTYRPRYFFVFFAIPLVLLNFISILIRGWSFCFLISMPVFLSARASLFFHPCFGHVPDLYFFIPDSIFSIVSSTHRHLQSGLTSITVFLLSFNLLSSISIHILPCIPIPRFFLKFHPELFLVPLCFYFMGNLFKFKT